MSSASNIKLFNDTEAMSADPAFLSLAESLTRTQVDEFLPVRCPDNDVNRRMEDKIAERDAHDSTGASASPTSTSPRPSSATP